MGLFAIAFSIVATISVMAYVDSKTEGFYDTKFYYGKALTVTDAFAA